MLFNEAKNVVCTLYAFFSLGCPDVMTQVMRINKPDSELSSVEKKINDFVAEDNFHYNFYLRDLAYLGYSADDFGGLQGVFRHAFSEESSAVRVLIYSLAHYLKISSDPIVTLAIIEVLEAGLYDLFITVYNEVVKKDGVLSGLEYYGDTHVLLERHHTVTSWFGMQQSVLSSVSDIEIPKEIRLELYQAIKQLMALFGDMYTQFNMIVERNQLLSASKFNVIGTPPIDRITDDWEEIAVKKRA